ncbi:MAG: hydrogenase nickel incorporation protein HypB [bacterium]
MEKIILSKNILEVNEKDAKKNRKLFKDKNIFVINIMGSPGCGKTTILESLIKLMKKTFKIAVIEGDLSTDKDACRIKKIGIPVVQINTDNIGNACHLNSRMISLAFKSLKQSNIDILFIENIGNLVCPAEFDLGENLRISITSISEGDDKVSKYPPIFYNSDMVLITKTDLLPYFKYNIKQVEKNIEKINPKAKIFKTSVKNKKDIVNLIEAIKDKIISYKSISISNKKLL